MKKTAECSVLDLLEAARMMMTEAACGEIPAEILKEAAGHVSRVLDVAIDYVKCLEERLEALTARVQAMEKASIRRLYWEHIDAARSGTPWSARWRN